MANAEQQRLTDSETRKADWKNWGPYVSYRAWGTVREDYSADGEAWDYFPFEHAHLRAYRWNEDALAGVCNRFQNVCLGLALWNGRDPILKERLFGLSGKQGNHGEDVKEYYYHLDNVPTHSYMKFLYKYPQVEFPYDLLREENARRDREADEFELADAIPEAFRDGRYFDVFVEYAKADQEDLLCRIVAHNRGAETARLDVCPLFWYRNTWSWGYTSPRHQIHAIGPTAAKTEYRHLKDRFWFLDDEPIRPVLLFTENDSNLERLYGVENETPYVKDGFADAIIYGDMSKVNPERRGSKAAGWYRLEIPAGRCATIRHRLSNRSIERPFERFDECFDLRIAEADEFHASLDLGEIDDELRAIRRQAIAGLLWSKQFYHYSVELWLDGDPGFAPPPAERKESRNSRWRHLYNLDVVSMPDKWEYPWYAAWDLAFHTVALSLVDPEWAKRQLILLSREWYMHPSGQFPSYEWNFDDVNPPVHAWAALKVYKIDRDRRGKADTDFLEEIFHKLLLNFTWWVNRQDQERNNIFQGGFLGLDNIGVFDRSKPLPGGGRLEQADGTAWMGMYCLNMLDIALELADTRPPYESVATKFFEHFVAIAEAINGTCGSMGLWEDQDGFYYDMIRFPGEAHKRLRVRSFVGLIPLFAVATISPERIDKLPQFRRRVEWFIKYRPHRVQHIASLTTPGEGGKRLLAIVDRRKLERIAPSLFDPARFLSDHGLRSLSRRHADEPFRFDFGGTIHAVDYEPGESRTPLFGGNSNWRGPVWFPVNFLMIESLRTYHEYYGSSFQVEAPAGSGERVDLARAADLLSERLISLFRRDPATGRRPAHGPDDLFQTDPRFRDYLFFHEYFHGDTGRGLGACAQTGWTALVANLIQERSRRG